ncbi:sorbitol dehydrogenase family protein [Alcaligenaceae bacterium CGII-47]|nr:sorbitol dehydrogenase family protein [Alcaligenaceae bacterium CGII-47]
MIPRRRAILLSGLAIATTGVPRPGLTQTVWSLDEFLTLSSHLTGFPVTALDRTVGTFILQSFEDRGMLPALRMLSGQTDTNPPLTKEIIATWYTGICQTTTGLAVATHDQALVWHSAPYLHPPGICGGAFGYWSEPPTLI